MGTLWSMPRRSRQVTALAVVAGGLVVMFLGGVAFEAGRYVARAEIPSEGE